MTEPLRIVTEKELADTCKTLVNYFYHKHRELFGKKPLAGYGEMIGRTRHKYEKPDPNTGEIFIDYPEMDSWKEEVDGYLEGGGKDKSYSFAWFIATIGQYGTYRRAAGVKKELELLCTECGATYSLGGRCKCLEDSASTQ